MPVQYKALSMSEKTNVTITSQPAGYQHQITAGSHQWTADEPETYGGTDAGPSPYELLLGALGACIGMTLRMYAAKKKWKLTDVHIELEHYKIHAKDCEDCEQESGYVDVIEKSISFSGDLDADQRNRLLEIASRCPVHRTLENAVKFRVKP